MTARRRLNLPSFGCFLIAGSLSLSCALLAWGWQTPELDRAFEVLARRESSNAPEFSPPEIALLQRVWDRHSGFARALVGKGSARFVEPTVAGWFLRRRGHLAVRPETERPAQFTLEARGEPSDFPLVVKLSAKGYERRIELSANQPQNLEISAKEVTRPRILEVEVTPARGQGSNAATFGLRLITGGVAPVRDIP